MRKQWINRNELFDILDHTLENCTYDPDVYDDVKTKMDDFKLKRMGEYSEEDFKYCEDIFELEEDIRSIHHLESKYNLHIGDKEMCELYDLKEILVFKLIDETRRINVNVVLPSGQKVKVRTEKDEKKLLEEYKQVSDFVTSHLNDISKS